MQGPGQAHEADSSVAQKEGSVYICSKIGWFFDSITVFFVPVMEEQAVEWVLLNIWCLTHSRLCV